jgi:hypothetical protein
MAALTKSLHTSQVEDVSRFDAVYIPGDEQQHAVLAILIQADTVLRLNMRMQPTLQAAMGR